MFFQEIITEGSVEPAIRKKNGKIMFAFNGGVFFQTQLCISAGMSWALPEKVEYRFAINSTFPGDAPKLAARPYIARKEDISNSLAPSTQGFWCGRAG